MAYLIIKGSMMTTPIAALVVLLHSYSEHQITRGGEAGIYIMSHNIGTWNVKPEHLATAV